VTAMLALALGIGDRIHKELAVYGANIVVTPRAADLAVSIGGVDLHPATGNATLHESDLAKLQTIFWHNNITAVSPEELIPGNMTHSDAYRTIKASWIPDGAGELPNSVPVQLIGYWFNHPFGSSSTGAPQLHPWWKLQGRWPSERSSKTPGNNFTEEVVLGSRLAQHFNLHPGDRIGLSEEHDGKVVGIVTSGDKTDDRILYALDAANSMMLPIVGGETKPYSPPISRIEIAARTRPEDAFARVNPESLSPAKRDVWYCRPYANSIAYQIREAIPGADAQQVRRVEQSEGTVLSRISGLLWLVSAAALLAAAFAVSAAMATAVLERRQEIGLMRSLGAGKASIATLFYAESGLLAVVTGILGFLAGSLLAHWLGASVFPGTISPWFNPVLLPIIVALALIVAILGSTPAIREALNRDPGDTLRGSL
jgi:putative ABC transport system permease protein